MGPMPSHRFDAFAPVSPALAAEKRAAHPPQEVCRPGSRSTASWCGGWHESSAELRRGLEVIEHDWPLGSDSEALMELVSFG